MRVAIIFQRFGPYHVARLTACAEIFEPVGIELSAEDSTYQWEPVRNVDAFNKITLFDEEHPPTALLRNKVFEILNNVQPDVVAVPGWSFRGSLAAIEWSLARQVPFVLMSDSQLEDKQRFWFAEWFKRRVVRLAGAALVAGSRHVQYLCALGAVRESIYTGYDVVDNQHFAGGGDKKPAFYSRKKHFITVCRFVAEKNLLALIEVYSEYLKTAGEDAFELLLVGDGPLRTRMAQRIDSLGLGAKIHLAGFRQYDALPELYHDASICILPSRVEPWGLVVNEAMAAGLPVLVSSRCGCAPDLVADGVNGYTFDPDNRKQWLELMLELTGEKTDLAAMGEASRKIIQQWTPKKFAASLHEASRHALTEKGKQPGVLDRIILTGLSYR